MRLSAWHISEQRIRCETDPNAWKVFIYKASRFCIAAVFFALGQSISCMFSYLRSIELMMEAGESRDQAPYSAIQAAWPTAAAT